MQKKSIYYILADTIFFRGSLSAWENLDIKLDMQLACFIDFSFNNQMLRNTNGSLNESKAIILVEILALIQQQSKK